MRRSFSLSILVASLMTVTLFADNWPQWRGPELNGVSRERGLVTNWTQTENVAWKLPMPSRSGATPIVWNDTIFLNVALHPAQGELELWSVDRNSGAVELEASPRGRQQHAAQAEHVVAVPRDRRLGRVGRDGYGHPQSLRLQRQRALDARHPEGIRPVRSELWLRVLAASLRRRVVPAGAARDVHGRSVVRPPHRQEDRPDGLAYRAADRRTSGVAGLVHDSSADQVREHGGDRDHRRRRRDRARSVHGERALARARPEPRSDEATIASFRRRWWREDL